MDNISIKALADLLTPADEESDGDDEPKSGYAKIGPGDVGPPKKSQSETVRKESSKDIWDADEVPTGAEYDDVYDTRPQPEYEILYKQSVTSEDIFLQMGNKTPSTASCEDMIIKIKLPSTKIGDVKLDVKDTFLDCRSPKYKLGLHLPYPVDSKNGKAQWNGDQSTLTVTLRMARDMDFMNF